MVTTAPGAGAGGASSAYHLSKFARAAGVSVNITVFDRNPYIGGRSTTVHAYDDPEIAVELGASIFVEINSILYNRDRRDSGSSHGRVLVVCSIHIGRAVDVFIITFASDRAVCHLMWHNLRGERV